LRYYVRANTVCAQDAGWGCIADNMLPKPEQVSRYRGAIARYSRNINVLIKDAQWLRGSMGPAAVSLFLDQSADAAIRHADVAQGVPAAANSIDLIVTSPPYPNMTDYATAQRLSYYWMGGNLGAEFGREIGSRRRRTRPSALDDYARIMKFVATELTRVLKPGGHAAFVMPVFDGIRANDVARMRAVTDALAALENVGLTAVNVFDRVLPTSRRHHNSRWATLRREHIHVYTRL